MTSLSRSYIRQEQWNFFIEALHSNKEECVSWPYGKMGRGYGSIMDIRNGEIVGAHRLSCQMVHGDPPTPKHHAAHSCGTPSCINPKHVRWATPKENAADKKIHGTNNDGEKHGRSKLSNAQVAQIRTMVKQGAVQLYIARLIGVSPMTISRAVRGESYRKVA